jgi:dihydroflavonol-4-reductase
VKGTRNVLVASRERAPSVKRVVVTRRRDVTADGRAVTSSPEADWNVRVEPRSTAPYYYARALAERRRRGISSRRDRPGFDLVVVALALVITSLGRHQHVEEPSSSSICWGAATPGLMNLTWGFVDVRDVADAHVRAIET